MLSKAITIPKTNARINHSCRERELAYCQISQTSVNSNRKVTLIVCVTSGSRLQNIPTKLQATNNPMGIKARGSRRIENVTSMVAMPSKKVTAPMKRVPVSRPGRKP